MFDISLDPQKFTDKKLLKKKEIIPTRQKLRHYIWPNMSNWISSGMGMDGIPTTDNIPKTTKKLGFPTEN